MNTVEEITILDNRVYVTVSLSGIEFITLRFYIKGDKNRFIKNLSAAVNYPTFIKPTHYFGCEDESYVHEHFIKNTIDALTAFGVKDILLTGVSHKENKLQVTEAGRIGYVVYMNCDSFTVSTIEVFCTYEEAFIEMLGWCARYSDIIWNNKKRELQMSKFDRMLFEFLHSIDTIEEFIKYKYFYDDQIKFLVEKGFIVAPTKL